MKHRTRSSVLPLTLLAASACGTQEIDAKLAVIGARQVSAETGTLAVVFPTMDANYAAEQARVAANPNLPRYEVSMDGAVMMFDPGDGSLSPFMVQEGVISAAGHFKAGSHHFTIAAAGSPPIFDGDGDVVGNGTTALFLFGTLDALQGRFVDSTPVASSDVERIILSNLMRTGQEIELVSCTDVTTCTAVGDPLGPGESFVAELPAVGTSRVASRGANGAGYAFRMVPSAAVPNPSVQDLHASAAAPDVGNFLAAPIYMSNQGDPQMVF